jgi:hypothetical protein
MTSNEYSRAFNKSFNDLSERLLSRDLLNAQIAGLREEVRILSSRVTLTEEERNAVARLLAMVDYATPNLTDSIRALLTKVHPTELTAVDVRNALEESSFNFDEFSNSLSACHAALKRLLADGKVEAGTTRNGKQTYKAVLPKLEPPVSLLDILAGNFNESVSAIVAKNVPPWSNIHSDAVGRLARALEAEKKKK